MSSSSSPSSSSPPSPAGLPLSSSSSFWLGSRAKAIMHATNSSKLIPPLLSMSAAWKMAVVFVVILIFLVGVKGKGHYACDELLEVDTTAFVNVCSLEDGSSLCLCDILAQIRHKIFELIHVDLVVTVLVVLLKERFQDFAHVLNGILCFRALLQQGCGCTFGASIRCQLHLLHRRLFEVMHCTPQGHLAVLNALHGLIHDSFLHVTAFLSCLCEHLVHVITKKYDGQCTSCHRIRLLCCLLIWNRNLGLVLHKGGYLDEPKRKSC